MSATATIGPFAHAIGFNASGGANHITAQKTGLTFVDLDIFAFENAQVNTLTLMVAAAP
jgi:hypothetical protein